MKSTDLRLLRISDVCARIGIHRSNVYRLVAAGKFPRPITIGERSSAWLSDEIDAWLAQRVAERDAGGGRAA